MAQRLQFNTDYWVMLWMDLRKMGEFAHADELKEMLRRIGFVVSVQQDKAARVEPVYKQYGPKV